MNFALFLLGVSHIHWIACATIPDPKTIVGTSTTHINGQSKNIFGSDNRVPITDTGYPLRTIGKLSTGCTGTLVGRDLVLTAAHCIIDPQTQYLIQGKITFYPNLINNNANLQADATYVWWGTNQPDTYREDDWALIRLNKPLGDIQGWFCTRRPSLVNMTDVNGTLVGYSVNFLNGQTAGAHIGCRIVKQQKPKFYLHDCDMGRGASGGPIFAYWNNEPCIYALNVAEYRNGGDVTLLFPNYTDENANIAIWSDDIIDKIIEMTN